MIAESKHRFLIPILIGLAFLAAGCGRLQETSAPVEVPGGDPGRGQQAIVDYGCQSCHTIPGIRDADALVAPPLDSWAERSFIAGRIANNPDNLIQWIMDPQSIDPLTAMPNMGVSEQDARDISAYLFSLQRGR
jgi:cytochrome c